MPLRPWLSFVALAVLLSPLAAQTPSNASVPSNMRLALPLAEPAVPPDPLELVTGDAQAVQDVTERGALINLLLNAYRSSNVRASPYDLKTSFTAFGSTASDGAWQLQDTSPGAGLYRWTAQGPSFSVVNLFNNRVLYSSQPAASLPLRLSQVRAAIFFAQPTLGPRATLRVANGSLNGAQLTCALVSYTPMLKSATGGRRWEEAEYCVDSKSGHIVTHSPVPGFYVFYDFSKALPFHDRQIFNRIIITQAGKTIIETQTVSVTDASPDQTAFQPAGLNAIGVGPIMTAPWTYRMMVPTAANSASQMVIVHGMRSADGRLSDLELIASSNASLNSAALAHAAEWQGAAMVDDVAAGATPQSHEIFITLQYANFNR